MPSLTPAITFGPWYSSIGATFSIDPNGSTFSVLVGQEADGSFRFVQTTAGVVQTTAAGGASGTVAQGAAGSAAWPVADGNSAAWQGVVALTPGSGTPATAGRGLGFICTAAGTLTLTLANASTMAFPIAVSANLQTLGFAVTGVALSGGAAGTFWNLV